MSFEDSKVLQLENQLKEKDEELRAKRNQLEAVVAHMNATEKDLLRLQGELYSLNKAFDAPVAVKPIPAVQKTVKEKAVIASVVTAISVAGVALVSGIIYSIVKAARKGDDEDSV